MPRRRVPTGGLLTVYDSGQEEENARSLVDNGAGVVADNIQDLGIVVKRLLESPSERESLRRNALALSKPNATAEIIQAIRER